MPRKPLSAAASGLPKSTEDCPVAVLAREFSRIVATERDLDEVYRHLDDAAKRVNRRREDLVIDRREFIEGHASHLIAKSGLGALFQLNLLLNAIHDFRDLDLGPVEKEEHFLRIDRIAYSLLDFITGGAGTDAGFPLDFYMPDRLNPHVQLDKAINGMKDDVAA
jgi:hypothetical protein